MIPSGRISFCAGLALLVLPAAAHAEPSIPGAVQLSDGTQVPQALPPKPLHLTNAQREQIRRVVLTEHVEVEFRMASTKSAKDFTPSVGAKLPSAIKPMGLPQTLLAQMPQLANYGYTKVKNQVLIVDATTGKVVDIFSETQPLN
jgi:hypothetical protein